MAPVSQKQGPSFHSELPEEHNPKENKGPSLINDPNFWILSNLFKFQKDPNPTLT